jgi:hypothetical protein
LPRQEGWRFSDLSFRREYRSGIAPEAYDGKVLSFETCPHKKALEKENFGISKLIIRGIPGGILADDPCAL